MKKSNLTYIKYNYIFSVFARKSRSYIFTRRIPINIAFPINQTTILHFRCSLPENFHWFHYFIIFPLSGFSDGGAFSGKAGSFIGSNWRDINYIKGILRISNKPKTQKQLEQQAKFALAVRFLRPVKLQVEAGFSKIKQGHTTSYNLALKQILVNAITGTYPDYEIDYAYAAFSQGPLSGVADIVILPKTVNLAMSWSTRVLKANSFMTDEVQFLVYEPVSSDYVVGPPSIPRSSQAAEIAMPSDWVGKSSVRT